MSRYLKASALAATVAAAALLTGSMAAASPDFTQPMGTLVKAPAAAAPEISAMAKPRPESVADRYADAKTFGTRAFADIDKAWTAIAAKDAAAARHALTSAIAELDRARTRASYHVIATGYGTVSDWWVPAGTGGPGDAAFRLGEVTPQRFVGDAAKGAKGHDAYESLLMRDGYQVMLPVRDARTDLKSALAYVREGNFAGARSAMQGLFDSSVKVSTAANLTPSSRQT